MAAKKTVNEINRRTLITGTAAAVVAAPVAASAKPDTSKLAALIEESRKAFGAYVAALDAQAEFESGPGFKSREIFAHLSIGGGKSRRAGTNLRSTYWDLRSDIVSAYTYEIHSLKKLGRVSPAAVENLTAELLAAQAADLRALRSSIREEQARRDATGYSRVYEDVDATCHAENALMDALLAYRCETIEEIHMRADYLAEYFDRDGGGLDHEQRAALLASMRSEAQA